MPILFLSQAALRHNYRLLRQKAACPLIPVLKADAYGHGADRVLAVLREEGASLFALANERELFTLSFYKKAKLSLQKSGSPHFLLLGPCDKESVRALCHAPVLLSVHSLCYARMLEEQVATLIKEKAVAADFRLPIHLKAETGMHRLGLTAGEARTILHFPHLRAVGLYSHFAEAAEGDSRCLSQAAAFFAFRASLGEAGTGLFCHMSAGCALLRFGALGLDGVRAGLALYGIAPLAGPWGLRPVMRLSAKVLTVKAIGAGEGLGYGKFRATVPLRAAVLDIGYADGLPPSVTGGAHLFVHGRACPFLGEVCMDRAFIDVGTLPLAEAEVGS